MARGRKIKVVYRKLGKEKVYGLAHSDGLVEIDERLFGKKHLEILLHECAHLLWAEDSEEEIIRKSVLLCNTLWHENYRRIDGHNHQPLQDGSI